jgi:hypothetical protein
MAKQLILRTASATGLLVLAFFFVGVDPFLSAGAVPSSTFTVDRTFKGDRLPILIAPDWRPDWQNEFGNPPSQPRAQMPFACDAAFSVMSSRAATNYYGRCLA